MNESLRREPFRILFPLGALLAWAAVLPWVLFGSGVLRVWLGTYHALTMTQGFLVAMAFGFLGTMLPRRTGTAPLSTLEIVGVVAALAAVPIVLAFDSVIAAEVLYLFVLGTLVRFAVVRMRRGTRPGYPSFVFLPAGLLSGMVGAGLVIAGRLGSPALFVAGRALVEEVMLLSLIVALAPMLASIIMRDRGLPDPTPEALRWQRPLYLLGAALLAGSVPLGLLVAPRLGPLVRGIVVFAALIVAARPWQSESARGAHRRLFELALLFMPVGELAAGIVPAYQLGLLHLTFIGGFSLLVFAVSFHVVFLHTGREQLARRRLYSVAAVGALIVVAALARAGAERFSSHYVAMLTVASLAWLVGAVGWGLAIVRLVVVRAPATPPEGATPA